MFVVLLLIVSLSFGVNIEEAIRIALKNNPEIKALKEEMKVFEGKERSATAFPNPELRFESGFITNTKDGKPKGNTLYLLEFNQPIPIWGVREKASKVVQKEKEAFYYFLESQKRRIIAQVYRSFYKSLFLKETARIWKENYETAKEVEEFVEKAYKLGDATELELLRAKRERSIAELKLKVSLAEYEASLKDLSRLLGRKVEDVEGDLSKDFALEVINVEKLPTIVYIKKRIEAIENQIKLEKALAKPKLTAGFVLEESESNYHGLRGSFTLKLPLFYRRQGEILQNIAIKEALRRRLEAELLKVKNKIEAVRIKLETFKRELKKLEEEVIPRAEEELALAIKSYKLKVITLLELSDVRRKYYELLISRAELLFNIHKTYSEFIEIGGWKR